MYNYDTVAYSNNINHNKLRCEPNLKTKLKAKYCEENKQNSA